jgi:hypothetical protein
MAEAYGQFSVAGVLNFPKQLCTGRGSEEMRMVCFQKGVGDPTPFTVSLMPFFRGFISKACLFCMLLQDISKKGVAPPTY